MFKHRYRLLIGGIISVMLVLSGCSGDGGGDGAANTATAATTSVSGKVTLSSVVSGGNNIGFKARLKAVYPPMAKALPGRPLGKVAKGTQQSHARKLNKLVTEVANRREKAISGISVQMFDADKPEWLYPIAAATSTGAEGAFKLDTLVNGADNGTTESPAYKDGVAVPSGKYTIVAVGQDCSDKSATDETFPFPDPTDTVCDGNSYRIVVGIQAVVKEFAGDITGNDLSVQSSSGRPQVVSIVGKRTNDLDPESDGSYLLTGIKANGNIQIVFNAAMKRSKTPTAIKLMVDATEISGVWKMSPDLTIATFYPDADLVEGTTYTLTVDSNNASNYYGNSLSSDFVATFAAEAKDVFAPNADNVKPNHASTDVDLVETIAIQFNEPIDISNLLVTSSAAKDGVTTLNGLGARPAVRPLGDNWYQIIPANPLQLDAFYELTVSGVTDLAGNSMIDKTWQFTTIAQSQGVLPIDENSTPEDIAQATTQSEVKSIIANWVSAINNSDQGMFGSLLAADFVMEYNQDGVCSRQPSDVCTHDADRSNNLDFDEFMNFIDAWFSQNDQMDGWTGDEAGLHIVGNVPASEDAALIGQEIKVDIAAGSAAFEFNLDYEKADGTSASPAGEGTIKLFLALKSINGAWVITTIGDREIGPERDASSISELQTATLDGAPVGPLAEATRNITFDFVPVAGASSYAVILNDLNDPSGSTGWIAVVDAGSLTMNGASATVNYSTIADVDPADGALVILGGNNGPFEREVGQLQDGGSYGWTVVAFSTITATDFVNMTKDPESDITAWSSFNEFSIGGQLVQDLTVTLTDGTSPLAFDTNSDAFTAGEVDTITIDISSTGKTEGKIFVYGQYYGEKSFTFDSSGLATVEVGVYEGYNWIDITDGVNWWYASSGSNNVYVANGGGIQPTAMVVTGVATTDGTTETAVVRADGQYRVDGDKLIVEGTATAGANVYAYANGIAADGKDVWGNYSTTADTTTGTFTFELPIYKGWNWISVYDDFGNWANVDVFNSGAGATYVDPFSGVAVTTTDDSAVSPFPAGTVITGAGAPYDGMVFNDRDVFVVDTPATVNITGATVETRDGWWYMNNADFGAYFDGIMFVNDSGLFNFPLQVYSGENWIDLNDANWNWKGITVINLNTAVKAPHEITGVLDSDGTTLGDIGKNDWGDREVDAATSCAVTIEGSSPASANRTIYGDVWTNDPATGVSSSSIFETTADADGNYSATIDIYRGENWVNVNDANWIWQNVLVKSNCDNEPVGLDVTGVFEGFSTTLVTKVLEFPDDPYSYEYYTTMGSSVTIDGFAKPDATVRVNVNGVGFRQVSTTADAEGAFSVEVILLPDTNWIDVEDGGNWRFLEIRTMGGLDCSDAAPCNDQFAPPPGECFDCGPIAGAMPPGSTVVNIISPFDGDADVGVTMLTATIDTMQFPLVDANTVVRVAWMEPGMSQPTMVWSNNASDVYAMDTTSLTVDVDGNVSLPMDLASMASTVFVGVWDNVADNPEFMDPAHAYAILLNGMVSGGDGMASGGDGPMLGANPPGDTNVMISSPVTGEVSLGAGTVVTGTMTPLAMGQVARLVVFDPVLPDGGPIMFVSSMAGDPLFTEMRAPETLFTVDAAGNFSIQVVLDPAMKAQIGIFVWADSMLLTSPDGLGAEPGEPMYGYMIEVN